jgi:hypothetical protein
VEDEMKDLRDEIDGLCWMVWQHEHNPAKITHRILKLIEERLPKEKECKCMTTNCTCEYNQALSDTRKALSLTRGEV